MANISIAMEASRIPLIRVFKRNGAIVRMAVPVFLELILSVLMGYVNQFLLASIPAASNGVSQSNMIANMFIVSFSVLSTSSLILLTQIRGEHQLSKDRIYSLSFFLNLIIGIIVSAILMGLSPFVFYWMGVDEEVIPYASQYLLYSSPSLVFYALTNVFGAFLRANKRMVFPTLVALSMNVVNALIAAIFIYGVPGLSEMEKMIGVAIATDISRFIGLAVSVIFFYKTVKGHIGIKVLRPFPKATLKSLLGIGLPTAGETLSYNFSQLVLTVIVNLAVSVLAQNLRNYIVTFTSIIYLFAAGTAIAMQVVEGNLLGEGKKDEAFQLAKDVGTMARTVSFVLSLIVTAIAFWVFASLMGPAIADESLNPTGLTATDVGLMALYCMLIDILLDQGRATNLVYVKALETSGDVSFPVSVSIFTSWVFTVGVSALLCLVFNFGIYGAFIGAMLDECVRGLIFVIRWKKGGWRNRTLADKLD